MKVLSQLTKTCAIALAVSANRTIKADGWLCSECLLGNEETQLLCFNCMADRNIPESDKLKLGERITFLHGLSLEDESDREINRLIYQLPKFLISKQPLLFMKAIGWLFDQGIVDNDGLERAVRDFKHRGKAWLDSFLEPYDKSAIEAYKLTPEFLKTMLEKLCGE